MSFQGLTTAWACMVMMKGKVGVYSIQSSFHYSIPTFIYYNEWQNENGFFNTLDACTCGRSRKSDIDIDAHIAHGEVADPDKYPWIVWLLFLINSTRASACTGSFLDRESVLTAGHCIPATLPPGRISVHVGNDRSKLIKVESFEIHESFKMTNGAKIGHDIAVLKLKRPYPDDVIPICLPSNPSEKYDHQRAVAAGFGLDEHMKLQKNQLMHTNVTILPISDCSALWSEEAFKNCRKQL